MQVLLDTHTFIWWIEDDPQLSDPVREIIGNGANTIFFSAASGWEIAIKSQIGKLRIADDLERFVAAELQSNDFTVLPIQLSHVLRVSVLPLHHSDPFDRILVAQCQLEQLPLLTVDPLISQYGIQTIW